jgi:LysR family transcriptional regulator, regulator of gene expression of beta-lactamase
LEIYQRQSANPPAISALPHLRDATLIFVPHLPNEWPCWFEAAGVSLPVRPAGEVLFDNNAMAMQAVLDGVGIAVAQLAYVGDAWRPGPHGRWR